MTDRKPRIKGRGRAFFLFVVALFVFTVIFYYLFLRAATEGPPVFSRARLTIESADGKTNRFDVEVAATEEQRNFGLMNRQSMPLDSGMIFVFRPAQEVSFWMKNTYIPLDILFVREDGVVVKIIQRAEPMNLTPLVSGETVIAVIEINGGEAARRGIKIGDIAHGDAL